MTIKRRLFISNMLMLLVPAILSIIMLTGMEYIFLHKSPDVNRDLLNSSIENINKITNKWSKDISCNQMKDSVNSFNKKHKDMNMSLFIYKGKNLIYPSLPVVNNRILDIALLQNGDHLLTMDNITIYRKSINAYTLVLINTNPNNRSAEDHKNYHSALFNLEIIIFLFTIIIIFLTNRFLTQFVFKSITKPLDTLIYGVHQIRDGNLNYHIEYNGKDEFLGICSDFNEMAQRLLKSVNERQKDEANRKELIAGISHDLRTPLTSIKAYVEGIEKGVASTPETQKRYLNIIKNKTTDLEHIVNQLFLFSKLNIGEFPFYLETFNLGKELFNMMSSFAEEYEKKGLIINLVQNIENTYVQADIVQLRNAVINILENSVKYKNKNKVEMKITCEIKHNYVIIKLADNGPGVSTEALEKLFNIFYRSDPSRSNPSKGSGLGLSITAKILEGFGGYIWAENVSEGGLAILMKLPIYTGGKNDEKNSNY